MNHTRSQKRECSHNVSQGDTVALQTFEAKELQDRIAQAAAAAAAATAAAAAAAAGTAAAAAAAAKLMLMLRPNRPCT